MYSIIFFQEKKNWLLKVTRLVWVKVIYWDLGVYVYTYINGFQYSKKNKLSNIFSNIPEIILLLYCELMFTYIHIWCDLSFAL